MQQIGMHMEAMILAMMIMVSLSLFPALGMMFLLLALAIVPVILLARSLVDLAVIPAGLIELARDRRARVNHALEHATVNVLEEKLGPQPATTGYATSKGFWLVTDLPDTWVASALSEAWKRMEAGESELAIHPRCGTTIAAGNLLFSGLFMATFLYFGGFSLTGILISAAAGSLLAPLAGTFLQRNVTTLADLSEIRPVGICHREPEGRIMGLLPMRRRRALFISTEERSMRAASGQNWGIWTIE